MEENLSLPIGVKPFRVRTREAWDAFLAGERELRALMDQKDREAVSEPLVSRCAELLSPAFSGAASTPAPFPTVAPSSFPQPPNAAITARHPIRANPLFFILLSSPLPAHLLYRRPSGFTVMPPESTWLTICSLVVL